MLTSGRLYYMHRVAKTQRMSDDLHGRYVEIKEEKKLINITA
jgi:hypothetical protein